MSTSQSVTLSQHPSTFPSPAQQQQADYHLLYLRVSGCYFYFTLFQLALTLVMLYTLHLNHTTLAQLLEIVITFMVALDLILRYFTEGTENFINNCDNKVNLFILVTLVVSIGSDLAAPHFTHYDGGAIAGGLLVVRYVVQGVRLMRLVIDSKKALDHSSHQNINLSDVVEDDNIE